MGLVQCKKRGLVTMGSCGSCPDFQNPAEDDPWGNPQGVCAFFRFIVKSEEEQQAQGIKMLYPGTEAHERASKEIAQDEDRDTDKIARKLWPIAKKLDIPKLTPRQVI